MAGIAVLHMDHFTGHPDETEFYINTIENHLQTNHIHVEKPHRHNFYVCMIFTKGSGIHEIDFVRYPVQQGSMFLLAPGQTHHWDLSDDCCGYIFFHTQEFFNLYFCGQNIQDYPVFRSNFSLKGLLAPLELQKILVVVFQQMQEEFIQIQWKHTQMIASLMGQVYIYTNRLLLFQTNQHVSGPLLYNNHFLCFEKLLDNKFLKEKSALYYADQLNITPKHLNRVCKTLTDRTTTDIISDRVVLEAKRMLLYTNKSFAEIAAHLGYDDYAYFSKLFKKKTNISAREFKKQYE